MPTYRRVFAVNYFTPQQTCRGQVDRYLVIGMCCFEFVILR
jgi:hypothetical protein